MQEPMSKDEEIRIYYEKLALKQHFDDLYHFPSTLQDTTQYDM